MTINVNNIIINVESEFQIVFDRLKQFEINNKKSNNKIIINKNLIDIKVLKYNLLIKNIINETDIYPIINNLVGYLINDKNNLYIHSVLVSKDSYGILILGDFKSGKTTLANEYIKNGYEINSADQTWIRNNKLVLGSMYNKSNNGITFLNKKNINKKVIIKKILLLRGNAKTLNINKIDNDNYYIKNIFKYSNWHYDMPILTKYIKLKDTGRKILEYLKNNKIDTYIVCGKEEEIVEAIDDRKEIIN